MCIRQPLSAYIGFALNTYFSIIIHLGHNIIDLYTSVIYTHFFIHISRKKSNLQEEIIGNGRLQHWACNTGHAQRRQKSCPCCSRQFLAGHKMVSARSQLVWCIFLVMK